MPSGNLTLIQDGRELDAFLSGWFDEDVRAGSNGGEAEHAGFRVAATGTALAEFRSAEGDALVVLNASVPVASVVGSPDLTVQMRKTLNAGVFDRDNLPSTITRTDAHLDRTHAGEPFSPPEDWIIDLVPMFEEIDQLTGGYAGGNLAWVILTNTATADHRITITDDAATATFGFNHVEFTGPQQTTFFAGQEVTFTASASDYQDADETTLTLELESSEDGTLGEMTAGELTTADLSVGTHTVTVSYTSGGKECSATIEITIEAAELPDPHLPIVERIGWPVRQSEGAAVHVAVDQAVIERHVVLQYELLTADEQAALNGAWSLGRGMVTPFAFSLPWESEARWWVFAEDAHGVLHRTAADRAGTITLVEVKHGQAAE